MQDSDRIYSLMLNLPLNQILNLYAVPLGYGCHAIHAKLHAADDKEAICSRAVSDASGVVAVHDRNTTVGAVGASAGVSGRGAVTTMVFDSGHF
jgi:hypothetical protein